MKTSALSSWFNSAKELYETGHSQGSRKLLLDIHKASPGFIPAIDLLSIIDYKNRNYSQAIKWIGLLLKQAPRNLDLINRQAMVLLIIEDIPGAIQAIDKGLELDPDHPGILHSAIKLNAKRSDQNSAKKFLERIPKDHVFYGKSEKYLGKYYANRNVLNNTLSIAYSKSNWPGALRIYQDWLKQNDPSADSYYNIGLLYMKCRNHIKAIHSLQKSLEFKPHFSIAAFLYMWYNKLMICDWSGYNDVKDLINIGISEYLETDDPDYELPIYILSFFELNEQVFAKCGTKIYQQIMDRIEVPQLTEDLSKSKIRIGYLSSSFWEHPVGRVYQDLFALHDRNYFEVFIYSTIHRVDSVSKQISEAADIFRDLTGFETKKAYTVIANDQIDILVTLGGHGDDMNMDLIAMKPAPLVVNGHGYNESLGGNFVDYIISDKDVIDDSNRPHFVEKILFLPGCAIPPISFEEPLTRNREYYGLPNDKFVYLSAAHPRKITPQIFMIWQEVLLANPDSVLWILDFGIEEVRENLLKSTNDKELEKRIFFSGLVPYREHLGRYYLADLLLDTPLYNCHSVGMEALRHGLPFVTLKGQNVNSRFGGSMLKTAGLGELICHSADEYLRKAVSLSKDHIELEKYRQNLTKNNPLFDSVKYVLELENNFKIMQERHISGSE